MADLEEIRDYLRENHPLFMHSTIRKLYDAARSLKQMPNRGRIGQMPETRELVLTPLPYLIVYVVDSETVNIIRILHGAKDRI